MQKEKACTSAQSSGKFIDTLIEHWISRTGSNISLQQPEEQVAECSNLKDDKKQQVIQSQEHVIESLKQKLKESQEIKASLSNSLEMEVHNKEEIQTKLDATWVYIENITEYFNYIRESLASFREHCNNLSTLYDNVILKQQETIEKHYQYETDQENHIMQLKNKLISQEERLQEAKAEQNKLQNQLENIQYKWQLQKNELINTHAEEKQELVKEQQRLLLANENLQLQLQAVEKEKCDNAKLAAQLENDLLLQKEKLEETLTEQNKLKKKAENAEREFQLKENELINTYDKEKEKFIEEQQRLLLAIKNLQLRLQTVEKEKCDNAKSAAQLENELLLQKEKLEETLTEQNKLKEKVENAERKLQLKENDLINTYDKEKEKLIEEQQRLILANKNLQLRLQTVEKEKCDNAKSAAQRENELLLQKEKLEETLTEQNKLKKKAENAEREFQLKENELMNTYDKEKEKFIEEQQRLLLANKNLQLRLQTVEKEKCDNAKSAAQLENELLLQKEKLDEMLTEQNILKKKAENAEREFQLKENELMNTYDKEKEKLIEELQKLQLQSKNMQLRLNTVEQDKIDVAMNAAQKDILISDLEDKISMYKNQIDTIMVRHNETDTNYEALIEKQNKQEKELLIKTEMIQHLEKMLNVIKQRESNLVNDVNSLDKRLSTEIDFTKSLETKLSITQKDLYLAQEQNTNLQKNLQETYVEIEACKKEKEEVIKQESTKTKNAETLYKNAQAIHTTEMLTQKKSYETQLHELKKTVDYLTQSMNDVKKENTALNKSLMDMKVENIYLKSNYDFTVKSNENLQAKLNETPKVTQLKSVDNQNPKSKFTKSQYSADTPLTYNSDEDTLISSKLNHTSLTYNSDEDTLISSKLNHTPLKRQLKEQEEEVTSASKKFFKSRSVQPRTYVNRRKN